MSKKYGQHGKLGVDGVARSALGFPRGEAKGAARLMRNGEMYRLPMQFVKKVLFSSLCLLI